MKTLGSHPGAILFRLSVMVIIIAILMVVFFRHVDDAQVELERQLALRIGIGGPMPSSHFRKAGNHFENLRRSSR